MSEAEFWEALRFRINCLPADAPAPRPALPGWCDWLEPRRYALGGPSPRITGRVGFVSGRDTWQLRFLLLLGRPIGTSPEVEWAVLLPPEGSGGWLSLDGSGEVVVIDPGSGVRAAAEPGAAADRGPKAGRGS